LESPRLFLKTFPTRLRASIGNTDCQSSNCLVIRCPSAPDILAAPLLAYRKPRLPLNRFSHFKISDHRINQPDSTVRKPFHGHAEAQLVPSVCLPQAASCPCLEHTSPARSRLIQNGESSHFSVSPPKKESNL
jgi:hypothetical protein